MPPRPRRIRSKEALQIARLDRFKFNEAVAEKYYDCAPPTAPGQSRAFTEERMIPLYTFARLLDIGIHPRVSGRIACELYAATREDRFKDEAEFVLVVGHLEQIMTGAKAYEQMKSENKVFVGAPRPGLEIKFNVATYREIIKEGFDEVFSIAGTDDE
jgi:hypothetical protein